MLCLSGFDLYSRRVPLFYAVRKLISQAESLFTGYVFHVELKIAGSPSKGHYHVVSNTLYCHLFHATWSEICPKLSDAEGWCHSILSLPTFRALLAVSVWTFVTISRRCGLHMCVFTNPHWVQAPLPSKSPVRLSPSPMDTINSRLWTTLTGTCRCPTKSFLGSDMITGKVKYQ